MSSVKSLKYFVSIITITIYTIFLLTFLLNPPEYILTGFRFYLINLLFLLILFLMLINFKYWKIIYIPIVFLTISVNFLSLEIFFSIKKALAPSKLDRLSKIEKEFNIKFDKRSGYQVARDLFKNRKIKAYPNFPNGHLIDQLIKEENNFGNILPLSDISNVTTVYCNENGERIIYKSNNYGFRSKDISFFKFKKRLNSNYQSSNNQNIFWLLGDSFTQGACVKDKYTLENLIGERVKPDLSYSFGQGDTSLLTQYAIYREYVKPFIKSNDKILIFNFPRNDFFDITGENRNLILNKYIISDSYSQNLIDKKINNEKDEYLKKYLDSIIKKRFSEKKKNKFKFKSPFQLNNIFYTLATPLSSEIRTKLGMEIYKNSLIKFAADVNKVKAKLYLVCIPSYFEFSDSLYLKSNIRSCEEALKFYANNNIKNLTLIKPSKEFLNLNTDKVFPYGVDTNHFSEFGYYEFAKDIMKQILDPENNL